MSLATVALIARLVLAAVFALAALTKLGRRAETEKTLEAFGAPAGLRGPIAVALPAVEATVAVALLPAASAPYAAVAALLLLAAFSVAVARTLVRGDQVDCNCFGALGEDRVSRWTLVRDLVLMVPAAFLVAVSWSDAGPSAVAWIGELSSTGAVAIVAGLALAAAAVAIVFAVQLMRQNGRLLERLEALETSPARASVPGRARQLGKAVPSFALPDLDGREITLERLLETGRELLLVFTDPNCHACNPILPTVGERQRRPDAGPLPVVMSLGDAEANRVKASEHGLDLVLLQKDFELAKSLGVSGMPGAVLVGRDGRIAAEPVENSDRVAELLAATAPPRPAAPPDLQLTMVEGRR
jgi:methylamine dehydrogenase accessory protein MauD